jgi:putative oxidoreductase
MMLVAFMVLVTLIFHTHLTDPNQLIHFLKNLAMTGGLFYVWAYGAGELSSDARTGASATDRTDGQQAAFSLIGRILLATIFMVSGVVKLLDPGGTHRQIHSMGLTTATPLLYIGSLVLEIGGGLSLLMGAWPRIGAVALIVFLIAATLLFHRTSLSFVIDAAVQDHQFHLMKNVAILGGLLYVWAFGAGRISFEEDPSVPRSQRPRVSY